MTRRFPELFWRSVARPALRRPVLPALNILGIALGVGVFLAVEIANRGALESFRAAVVLTSGRADLEVRGAIDDALLPAVAAVGGVRSAAPLVEGVVPLVEPAGEYLRIIGVDPFAGGEFLGFRLAGEGGTAPDFESWLRDPGIVAVSPEQAARMRSWSGDGSGNLAVKAAGRVARVAPAFEMLSDEPLARAEPRLAAMDIAWAQELLGEVGRLSAIQIALEENAEPGVVAESVRQVVPADVTVAPPASRNEELNTMLSAFQLNLTAMSLVSVVVGMFLIFNSVSAAVVRRQPQIAILRACGVTRNEVRFLFLAEAACEGALGALAGIAVASPLAGLLAGPVAGAVSSLYDVVRIESLPLGLREIALGLGAGICGALAAAWFPASEAARAQPAKILHPGAPEAVFAPRRGLWLVGAMACLALAFLSGWAAVSGGPKELGFVSAALVIAAFTLLVPWFVGLAARCGRVFGLTGRMAADHLTRSLHRNGITVAALAAAVAMSVAVAVMIHSFRGSLVRWVDRTLAADIYVAPAANEIGGLQAFLPDGLETWAAGHPDVETVGTFRELDVKVDGRTVSLGVASGGSRGELDFLPGALPDAAGLVDAGVAGAISESFATRTGFAMPGDGRSGTIRIPSPAGEFDLPVAGIYRDYTRDRGTIHVTRGLFQKHWTDPRLHSLAISLKDHADPEEFTADLRARHAGGVELAVYDNQALRNRIFEIFDQAFAVTSGLRAIAVFVAVVGVTFSLLILASERAREIGVLRAIGASRKQIFRLFLGEAGLLGLAAALAGLASGAVLAMVLTWAVNKAFFGWSIALNYPAAPLALTPLWVAAAAAAAAILPSLLAARRHPAETVRFE